MDIETMMKLIKPRTHNVHEVEWVRVPGYERNGNVDHYVTVRGCGPSHPRDLRPNTPLTHLSLKARHSTYDSLVYFLTWQVSCATNCVASLKVPVEMQSVNRY